MRDILQNQLQQHLPSAFLSNFAPHTDISYAAIPLIPNLPPPLREAVQVVFARSLKDIWFAMIGFSGLGLVLVIFMKDLPLQTTSDAARGLKDREQGLEEGTMAQQVVAEVVEKSGSAEAPTLRA